MFNAPPQELQQGPRQMNVSIRRMRALSFAVALGFPAVVADQAAGQTNHRIQTARICDVAAVEASRIHGVPVEILRAIALTETGRRLDGKTRPWPWTVNMEGAGHWFGNRAEARAYVEREVARGARSYDIGCFQINARWHGHAFPSLEAMFDPRMNADYAARFLSDLHAEFGDWSSAAGAYHSRTPSLARRYRARFDRFLSGLETLPETIVANMPEATEPAAPTEAVGASRTRENRFPLLLAQGQTLSPGSLVRLSRTAGPSPLLPIR